jgi:Flp pilus assembly protein TadD
MLRLVFIAGIRLLMFASCLVHLTRAAELPDSAARDKARYPASVVSAERLRLPLSGKARQGIAKARDYSNAGNHQKAIQELKRVLTEESSAAPYVHGILGFEYLQIGRVDEATVELENAVRLLPHEAINHSNLALSLYAARRCQQAEAEVRRALELDPHDETTKLVFNTISSRKNCADAALPDAGSVAP